MPDVVLGMERRPLVPGRLLFDDAAELSVMVPASCRRTGRCHECVIEIRAGGEQLSPRTEPEAFLGPGFRLACQARVERAEQDLEFAVLRRRLRIQLAPEATTVEVDARVRDQDGRRLAEDGTDLGPSAGSPLGVALDVGTTTVVLEIVDLVRGTILAVAAFENPQRFGGSDVVTRVSYDTDRPGELRQSLRRALNHELRRLYRALDIDRHRLVEMYVVGNPTMRDLFFGLDVRPIGHIPYRSVTETAVRDGARPRPRSPAGPTSLGSSCIPRPGSRRAADREPRRGGCRRGPRRDRRRRARWLVPVVDIGTNTEVIVSDGARILAASSPPARRSRAAACAMGCPVRRARSRPFGSSGPARYPDDRRWAARGNLQGSGLVDLLAELRRAEWLSPRGALADHASEVTVVADPRITFSRADIGHLAVAKAATTVGQRVLLRRLGITPAQLDHVYLAGGFANALDVGSAVDIGLLVPVAAERVVRTGNASIAGARALLLSGHRPREPGGAGPADRARGARVRARLL